MELECAARTTELDGTNFFEDEAEIMRAEDKVTKDDVC